MTLGFLAAAFFIATPVRAQKKTAAVNPVIFVVLYDGKWIDPIAVVSNGTTHVYRQSSLAGTAGDREGIFTVAGEAAHREAPDHLDHLFVAEHPLESPV